MVEVKNTEVFGLERALKAVRNSFTTTRINTTADFKDRKIGIRHLKEDIS